MIATAPAPTSSTPSSPIYFTTGERWQTAEEAGILGLCSKPDLGFWYFLPYWRFTNRETGQIHSFERLWEGQSELALEMCRSKAIFALKAGKLGFSELACAYDGWLARFGPPNARIHLMSRNGSAARELLGWVKFGLTHLPDFMRLPIRDGEAGGNTSTSLKLYKGPDDTRTIVSYASTPDVAIDQTCNHLHADEFTRWPFGERTWAASLSTISPAGGSLHIISRGRGRNWAGKVYMQCRQGEIETPGGHKLRPFFASFRMRPGRGHRWYEAQAKSYSTGELGQWAPQTWQQALQGDAGLVYPDFEDPEGRHVKHLASTYPLMICQRVGVGLDPGGGNPTAMVLKGMRASGGIHQYGEFYAPGASILQIVEQLDEWCTQADIERHHLRIACDGSEPVLIASLADYGFDAVAADKDRSAGIQYVKHLTTQDRLTYEPGCVNTIAEKYDYRWQEETDAGTRVTYAGSRPTKHHADAMDAERYILMDFAQYEPEEPVTLPRSGRTV